MFYERSLWIVLIWMKRICFRKCFIRWFHNDDATMWYTFLYKQICILYDNFMWWWSHEVVMCLIHKYIYNDFTMMICHENIVMLRSTTSPYRQLVIEVAYGDMIFSLHRGYMGDDSSGIVVRVSAWCIVHVWHTRVNTSVGLMYYFSVSIYKTYVYVYYFKNLYVV